MSACWWLLLVLVVNAQPPLKGESCDSDTCSRSLEEIESIIIEGHGHLAGKKLIEMVKASPELYVNDERPIIVELSNKLMDEKISTLSKRD